MPKPTVLEGGCLCGAIRFRAQGTPGKPHTCSCETCRRHSGALTVAWVECPADAVAFMPKAGTGGRTGRAAPRRGPAARRYTIATRLNTQGA
jgi:hypothetical protein